MPENLWSTVTCTIQTSDRRKNIHTSSNTHLLRANGMVCFLQTSISADLFEWDWPRRSLAAAWNKMHFWGRCYIATLACQGLSNRRYAWILDCLFSCLDLFQLVLSKIFHFHCDYCDCAIHERILVRPVSNTDTVSSIFSQVIMWRYWTWWKGWPQMPYRQLPWGARTGLVWLCLDAGWFWQTILISLLTLLWTVTTFLWTYCLIFRHTYVVWHGESWWASNPKKWSFKKVIWSPFSQKIAGGMRRAGSRLGVGRSQELQQEVWIGEIPKFATQRNSGNCLSSNLPFRDDWGTSSSFFITARGFASGDRKQDVIFRYGMEAVASYLTVEGEHKGRGE